MNALKDFLEMGGYARFVWPAYALAALVLAALLATSLGAYGRTRRELAALQTLRGGQAQRGGRRR